MVLQIFREPLEPGAEDEYSAIEEETARLCVELKCPHPYLAAESLTGPKEVWWFNEYSSQAEIDRVVSEYAKNAPLMEALQRSAARKAKLTRAPIEVFATHRPDVSRGAQWRVGEGRFLAIARATGQRPMDGTVFEAPDRTWFVVRPAKTREQAEALAAAAGPEAHVFAVRPAWSMPAPEWIAADPEFWR